MVKNLIRLFLLIVRKKMGSTVTKVFTLSIVIGITIIFLNTYYYSLREAFILNRAQANKTIFPNSMVSRFIKLCVLIRVHRAHLSYLPVIAFALSHSGFDKIQLYVINIDKNMNSLLLSRVIDSINAIESHTNFIVILHLGRAQGGDFGFAMTDRALSYLYDQHNRSSSSCQYIILTNGDNLYSRHLGPNIIPHMASQTDIIAWDFVSRYYRPDLIKSDTTMNQTSPRIFDKGTSKCMAVALDIGAVDLGAVAYRLEFLKRHRLHMHYDNGTYDAVSDGFFARKAASLANSSTILRQTLFFHQ